MQKNVFRIGLVFGIIVMLVGMGIIPSIVGVKKEKTTITTLDSPGYIQDLIDNASDGDTIYIPSGIYYENIIINKSISLIGEDKNTTIIDGNGSLDVVYVYADWVNITGFTIQNSYRVIDLRSNTSFCTIKGNNIKEYEGEGISIEHGGNIIIIDNNIISNYGSGIRQKWTKNNTISGNFISNCSSGIYSWVNSNSNFTDNIISYTNGEAIYLEDSNYINICHNVIDGCDSGISGGLHERIKNNNISYNTITSNKYCGINLIGSNNNIIGNYISNNMDGIQFRVGNNDNILGNNILGNNITLNDRYGIYLGLGYFFTEYYYNVSGNTIISNNWSGIYLNSIHNSYITGNMISNNTVGINSSYLSNNNIIYHNNFIDNMYNAHEARDNIWDDGKYGNYWSDYKEKYPFAIRSLLKPWMWNIPYEIEGRDNKDNCPLIKQWPNPRGRTIPRNKALFNIHPILLWLFERFPILRHLLGL